MTSASASTILVRRNRNFKNDWYDFFAFSKISKDLLSISKKNPDLKVFFWKSAVFLKREKHNCSFLGGVCLFKKFYFVFGLFKNIVLFCFLKRISKINVNPGSRFRPLCPGLRSLKDLQRAEPAARKFLPNPKNHICATSLGKGPTSVRVP